MKKKIIKNLFFILCMGITFSSLANIPKDLTAYKWKAEIQGEISPQKINKIQLPYEVLNLSSHQLNELLLVDENQKIVPFIIRYQTQTKKAYKTSTFKIKNYEESKNKSTIYIEKNKNIDWIDRILIETRSRNFNKKILIYEGSKKKRNLITENRIYDFSARINLKKLEIELPQTKSSFLILEIIDLNDSIENYSDIKFYTHGLKLENTSKKIKIDRILGFQDPKNLHRNDSKHLDEIILDKFKITESKDTYIDLGKINVNIEEILFKIRKPENYYRKIKFLKVLTDKKIEEFTYQYSDLIFNLPFDKPKNKVRLKNYYNSFNYIAMQIVNGDSPALDIENITLKWKKTFLYFEPNQSQKYTLYLDKGSHIVQPKNFDLNYTIELNNVASHSLTIQNPVSNSLYDKTTEPKFLLEKKKKKEKIILISIVSTLVIIIIFWLFSLFKNIPKED